MIGLGATEQCIFRLKDHVGQGSTAKTVHQLSAGVDFATAKEETAFGIKMGVEPRVPYDVITGCAASSRMLENRVPHALSHEFTSLSAVDIFVKDQGIVLEAARRFCFPLPLAVTARQQCPAAGYDREDAAAVIKVYRDSTRCELLAVSRD